MIVSSVSVISTATVADAPLTNVTAQDLSATEGKSTGLVTVVSFTDPGGAEPNSSDTQGTHYTAMIHWGDGSTSQGTIVHLDGNNYAVMGRHTFAEEDTYTITTDIRHEELDLVTATNIATVI